MVVKLITMEGGPLWVCLGLALMTLCHCSPAGPGLPAHAQRAYRADDAGSALEGGRRLFWTVPSPDESRGSPLDKNDGLLRFLITIWSKRAAERLNLPLENLKFKMNLLEEVGDHRGYEDDEEENERDTNRMSDSADPERMRATQMMKRGLGKLANLVSFGASSPFNYQLNKFRSSNRGYGVSSRSGSPPMVRSGRKIMKSMGLLSNVMSHLRNFAPANSQPRYIG